MKQLLGAATTNVCGPEGGHSFRKDPEMSKAPKEYHLISLSDAQSHGGFASIAGARQHALEEMLDSWEIYCGNRLVERHCPTASAEKSAEQ